MEQNQTPPQVEDEITGVDPDRLMAALSYVGVLVFVPLLISKSNPFVRWHIKQGIVVLVGYIIAIISVAWVPIVGNILWLGLIVISIAGVVQALMGRRWKIPGIGVLAEKFNI